MVDAFFQALSPVELDVYARAVAAQQATEASIDQAHQQQIERLRYEAALAERRFNRVDPDNRLVAAELERRWEAALQALQQAEATYAQRQQQSAAPVTLPAELREAFTALGQKLPEIWDQDVLTRPQKKALLRCLIDKVVIHRATRDCVHTRIVWRGGDTTTLEIPIPVGSFADLSGAAEMEALIQELSRAGQSDEEIAAHLTTLGHRSPRDPDKVLPNTVKIIRLRHGILQERSQSHPRHIPGCLTVPQIARALDVTPHWIYYRIDIGRIQVIKDVNTGRYLFPDQPDTLEQFSQFKEGKLKNLRFVEEYQDE